MQFIIILLVACQALAQEDGLDGYVNRDGDGDVDYESGNGEGAGDDQGPSSPGAAILMHHQELGEDGTFKYAFSADNGLQQKEAFHPDGSRTGSYSYVDPHGETVLVHYRADRHGFQVLDGSSIPMTPSLSAQEQSEDDSDPETPSYQVEDPDGGESSTGAGKSLFPNAASSSAPTGSAASRSAAKPAAKAGHHARFYRSATRGRFSKAVAADQIDQDGAASQEARDLDSAATSFRPVSFNGYNPGQRSSRLTERLSPFAPLSRQIQFPAVKRERAEAEVADAASDSGPEHAASDDNGDYDRHAAQYDDGSYERHARQHDDGSYPQHAVKYDDGSYEKYARLYGEGQYGDDSHAGQSDDEGSESEKRPTVTGYNDF